MIRARAAALLLGVLPPQGFAADFAVPTPPVAATVFLSGATLLREGRAELPAGSHRLLLPLPRTEGAAPAVTVEGARITGVRPAASLPAVREALLTSAQGAAVDALGAAEADLAAAEDALAAIDARIAGERAAIEVLRTVSPGGDPATIARAAREVAALVTRAEAAILAARPARRTAEAALERARAAAERARRAVEASGAPEDGAAGLIVEVEVDAPGTAVVSVTQEVLRAGWTPLYDMYLDSEAGTLRIERRAELRQETGAPWPEIALTLSTAEPNGRLAPSEPFPDIARIVDPSEDDPALPFESAEGADMLQMRMAPAPEAVVERRGLALSYVLPGAVTVPRSEDGAATTLALPGVAADPRIALRAVPEVEETAFLVATAVNPGETLAPGEARHWRDGALVGRGWLPGWAQGAEAVLPFGPVETLRLDHVVLSQDGGDRGVIRRGSERVSRMRFGVENTGAEAREVTALYALPVSEQDALRIEVTAVPPPDARDVEDARGVAAWEMVLAPGERREVELTFAFDWPEDRALIWQP